MRQFIIAVVFVSLYIGCQNSVERKTAHSTKTRQKTAIIQELPEQKKETDNKVKTPDSPPNAYERKAASLLAKKMKEERLYRQQSSMLAAHYIKTAHGFANANRYVDAYQEVLHALRLDPQNMEALQLKIDYGSKLGYRSDEVAHIMKEALNKEEVKIQQSRIAIRNKISQATQAIQERDFAKALVFFEQAKEMLNYARFPTSQLEEELTAAQKMLKKTKY
jgi:tetratricopeptide (TPR) repeat protein